MVYKHAVVAAFGICAQRGEAATKRGGWRPCVLKIVMEITLLIMENQGKIMELHLNFCGNPVIMTLHC